MGKKIKKKAPNPRKIQHRAASAGSQKLVLQGSGGNGDSDNKACKHYTKSTVELNRVLVKIRSSSRDVIACENCREERVNGGKGKERGKQPKRKGSGTRASESKSDANFLWVCLDCGRYFCGGGVSMLEPYGHARRHAKQEHHQWAVQADDPLISWCYSCSSSVPIEMPEEVIEVENEAAMNDRSWSLRCIANESLGSEKLKGHKVRGLLNLGNTCFFNSVMQNLFSLDLLRKSLICMERPAGPLFTALRTLFVETSRGADSKDVISPKALFGCICAKAPQFRGYQQQDSHELLRYLLDGLHVEEINARKASELSDNGDKINAKTKATIVDTIFSGQLSSTVSCMECHNTSVVNEPYLDLSLPVPSKKHSSKRVPPSSPKKINQRDKNKSLQFRSKGLTRVSTESVNLSTENTEQPSECSESGTAVPLPVNDNAMEAGAFTWMDYIGAEITICNDSSAIDLETSKQVKEIKSIKHYDHEVHEDAESTVQCVSELHNASCSNNLTVSLDTFVECSCKDEVPLSCASVSNVILFPYKGQEQEKEQEQHWTSLDRNSFSQVPDNTNLIDISLSVSCTAKFSCNQAEEEFDGFGDLFNEPEATSYLNVETDAEEDTDITLWIQNIQESSLEELDDTNALVSINSCLALFTKPEILSDEQAWYCEHCSKMLKKTREHEVSKLQATNLHVTVRPKMDEDEIPSKKAVANFHEDSASAKVLDNWRMNAFQKLDCQAEYSLNNGESNRNETMETAFCINMTCPDVLNRDMSESETSQYFSTSTCVNSRAQDCSTYEESNFHGINDHSSIENDGKKTEFDSYYLRSHTNKCVHIPCEDRSQAVNRVRKKGIKPDKAYPARDNKGEGIKMVKRVATKRILINRVPPILTIHLKRFNQDTRGRLTKLSGHVSFQETLDLRPYMDPRCIEDRTLYLLTGVIEHMGSMGGGHYISYTRGEGRGDSSSSCCPGQSWFYASDAYVKEVSLAEVLRSEAYILFYEKM